MIEGFDVSTWQAALPHAEGCAFAFARATYGSSPDVRYAQHAAAIRQAGLVLGAYAFGISGRTIPVADQARVFLEVAAEADLLALDLEAEQGRVPMSVTEARAFIAAIHAAGRKIGLYHSASGFPADACGADWRWVAAWGETPPAIAWTFWQYSASPFDRDRFAGDLAALRALAGGSDDMHFIAAVGGLTSSRRLRVPAGTFISGLDGQPLAGPLKAAADLVFVGNGDAHSDQRVVLVSTGNPYADKVVRPTLGMVSDGEIVDAPSTSSDSAGHAVELRVDGVVKAAVRI